ncbi:MAG: SMP-30/gluconolactonase/LRE family protein [Acidobacteriota bacterium]
MTPSADDTVDAARGLTYITLCFRQRFHQKYRYTIMSLAFSATRNTVKRLAFVVLIGSALIVLNQPQPHVVIAETLPVAFKSFESPQVHPLALTPDGTRLLAVNTPDHRLSVFQLNGVAPTLVAEIPVGLEPVSVAARSDREAWVTNWLSDSVSVVDLTTGNVIRTIDVGDEPTDVVFGGQQREMAFVCVSGLGQVKAYNLDAPADSPQVINIRGKQPRALARDSSGGHVFVSVFESGNQTTVVPANRVKAAGGPPKAFPKMKKLPPAPDVALIVKWDGSKWSDERGNTKWNALVPYTLADVDLVVIDATAPTPRIQNEVRSIGTQIGNSAFDPASNRLYVINIEAHNEVRFEQNLSGRFATTRVSIVDLRTPSLNITAANLNTHINLDVLEGSDAERALSLALPADIARGADGALYVAATGSAKVGVLDPAGAVQARINVGQGPTGLTIDEARQRLYVLNRFDETLSTVDLKERAEVARIPVGFNPESGIMREGRRFLYDGSLSAHGDLACASCHSNGHRDGLAWDLGNPRGKLQTVSGNGLLPSTFHPMKGPMTTQSLRGLVGNEPLHWRGDRSKLDDFNPAFMSLLGGPRELAAHEMAAFRVFTQTLTYPPNPLQNLDRTFPNPATGPSAERGRLLFNNSALDAGLLSCNACHSTSPGFQSGTNNLIIPGLLLQESQDFKVPQLRGLYQKLGLQNSAGEQLTGFGFIHDGSIDTLLDFLRLPVFTFRSDHDRRDVEAFVLAFDTGLAPAVGLQVTINGDNKLSPAIAERIHLLMAQANSRNCDLVVKGIYGGAHRGFFYVGNGTFQSDRQSESPLTWQALLQAADAGSELTFTGAPVGYGRRIGIDRDFDGVLDGDE